MRPRVLREPSVAAMNSSTRPVSVHATAVQRRAEGTTPRERCRSCAPDVVASAMSNHASHAAVVRRVSRDPSTGSGLRRGGAVEPLGHRARSHVHRRGRSTWCCSTRCGPVHRLWSMPARRPGNVTSRPPPTCRPTKAPGRCSPGPKPWPGSPAPWPYRGSRCLAVRARAIHRSGPCRRRPPGRAGRLGRPAQRRSSVTTQLSSSGLSSARLDPVLESLPFSASRSGNTSGSTEAGPRSSRLESRPRDSLWRCTAGSPGVVVMLLLVPPRGPWMREPV